MSSAAGFGLILAATDFSPGADRAWALAQRLARALGAELVLLHVITEPAFYSGAPFARGLGGEAQAESRREAHDELDLRVEAARRAGLSVRSAVRSGGPEREIAAAAAEAGAGLIVLGTQGHGRLGQAVLGSVAGAVMRLASCPVVSVPEGAT